MSDDTGFRIDLSQVKRFDPSSSAIHKMTVEEQTAFKLEEKKLIETMFTRPIGKTSYGDYAKVVRDGKVVATLSNEGYAMMSNAMGGMIGQKLPNDGDGPELAQRRAEAIAKLVGGKVEIEKTAMTQSQWNSREPIKFAVDFKEMAKEGYYGHWRELAGLSSPVSAQLIGQEGEAA